MKRTKYILGGTVLMTGALFLAGCTTQANTVNQNLSKQADSFQVERQVVFYNGITDKYILEVTGLCSVDPSSKQVAVTCEVAKGKYIKDIEGLSDNVTWFVNQSAAVPVNKYHFEVILRPSTIIPLPVVN